LYAVFRNLKNISVISKYGTLVGDSKEDGKGIEVAMINNFSEFFCGLKRPLLTNASPG
jgi:hypothetical protein